jgi:hypothetical protein
VRTRRTGSGLSLRLTDFDFLEAKCTHVAVITSGKGENTIYGGCMSFKRTIEGRWRSFLRTLN